MTKDNKPRIRIWLLLAILSVLGQIPALIETPHAQLPPYMQPSMYQLRLWLSFLIAPAFAIYACIQVFREVRKTSSEASPKKLRGNDVLTVFIGANGIILACIVLIIYVSTLFSFVEGEFPRDNIISNLNNIAANAHQYHVRPALMQGGAGSYQGFTIPKRMQSDTSWTGGIYTYNIVPLSRHSILIEGRYEGSINGAVQVTVDSVGKLIHWQFFGDFDY